MLAPSAFPTIGGAVGKASHCEKQQGGSAPMSKHCQEQIQMITMVKGRAMPTAPPIVNANADSRFASACSSFPDMLLLHRAPAPQARWMCVVNKKLTVSKEVSSVAGEAREAARAKAALGEPRKKGPSFATGAKSREKPPSKTASQR
jgi:hypothetical protein